MNDDKTTKPRKPQDLRKIINTYQNLVKFFAQKPEPYTGTKTRDREKRTRAIAQWNQKAEAIVEVYLMIYRRWYRHNKRCVNGEYRKIPIGRIYKRYNGSYNELIYGIVSMFYEPRTRGTFDRTTGEGECGLWEPRKQIKLNDNFKRILYGVYQENKELIGKILKTLYETSEEQTVLKISITEEQLNDMILNIKDQSNDNNNQ